jgi:hypothetical protein
VVFFPGVFGGAYFNVGKVVLLKRKFPVSWLRKGSKLGSTDSISSDHVAHLAYASSSQITKPCSSIAMASTDSVIGRYVPRGLYFQIPISP